jgi:hypothetical protein
MTTPPPPPPPPPPIQIYAELLSNIRTVSLVITLQTPSDQETRATLSADGQTLTVSHQGQRETICLPTQMEGSGGSATTLALPASPPAKELTLRLQLQEREPGLLRLEESNGGNEVPWSAASMVGKSICCKACDAVVVGPGIIPDWRDLPSENWADMMDLWHCHKPHEEDQHAATTEQKGYSASNRLLIPRGTAFVSLSHFQFSQDQEDLKIRKVSKKQKYQSVKLSTTMV